MTTLFKLILLMTLPISLFSYEREYDIEIQYYENNEIISNGRVITLENKSATIEKSDDTNNTSIKIIPSYTLVDGREKIHIELDLKRTRGLKKDSSSRLKTAVLLTDGSEGVFKIGTINGIIQKVHLRALRQ